MKLILASDEKTHVTDAITTYLHEKGHELLLLGDLVDETQKWHWAEIATDVGNKIASGEAEQAVLFCWSGTGVCMAANKVEGVRAGLCWDAETARLTRKWNNANVLCMSLRFTSEANAKEILDAWFAAEFDEEGLGQVGKLTIKQDRS